MSKNEPILTFVEGPRRSGTMQAALLRLAGRAKANTGAAYAVVSPDPLVALAALRRMVDARCNRRLRRMTLDNGATIRVLGPRSAWHLRAGRWSGVALVDAQLLRVDAFTYAVSAARATKGSLIVEAKPPQTVAGAWVASLRDSIAAGRVNAEVVTP